MECQDEGEWFQTAGGQGWMGYSEEILPSEAVAATSGQLGAAWSSGM